MLNKSTIPAVLALASLVMAGRNGFEGSHGRHQQLAPFLQNATSEARNEFQDIFKNETFTLAEQKSQVSSWAQKYGKQSEVADFQNKLNEKMNGFKKNATEFVNSLPGKLEEIYKIFENENQTRREQAEALRTFHLENPQAASIIDFIIRPSGDHKRDRSNSFRRSDKKHPNSDSNNSRITHDQMKSRGL